MTRPHSTRHLHSALCTALLALTVGACADSTAPIEARPLAVSGALAKQATTSSRLLFYDFVNVWIMNDDGTGATALLQPSDQAFDPSWAPDGKRILFNAYRGELEASIYSMNADGTQITRITRPPAGSIDIRPVAFGKHVAFTRWGATPATSGVFRINLDGTGEVKLVDGSEPASSPSGDRLAYSSNGDVHVYDAVLGTSTNLTNSSASYEADPSYSPNGKLILFVSSRPGLSEIYTMRVDGTALTRLASSTTDGFGTPKWSPDGKRIAFTRNMSDIEVMNADGSGLTSLTTTAGASEILTAWAR